MVTTSKFTGSLNVCRRAIDVYDELIKRAETNSDVHVYKACCLYALGENK
jgi:hypothetical protein